MAAEDDIVTIQKSGVGYLGRIILTLQGIGAPIIVAIGAVTTAIGAIGTSIGTAIGAVTTAINSLTTATTSVATAISNTFPRITGTFTLSAAATKVVAEPAVTSTSRIALTPTNAAAGTLQGSAQSLYISTLTVGASFTVATASGVAAAGGESFSYLLINP